MSNTDILIENARFRLVVGEDCIAKSLVCKANGLELLAPDIRLPLFTLTEARPFNNEIKLGHPNKRTVFSANRLRREGDMLIVGFEWIGFEAEVSVRIMPDYIAFTLTGFRGVDAWFGGLTMEKPPVEEFCLLQLPVAERKYFGQWLNVVHDDQVAVNVLATSPHAGIDGVCRGDCRILSASARREIRLKGCSAALIVSEKKALLDCIDALEVDYDLPRGVESRRSATIHQSIYWTENVNPQTVDTHIAYAKKCGMRLMMIYSTSIFQNEREWSHYGNYDFRPEYPNGLEDVKSVVRKIRAAGIKPGLHFLHTHVGLKTRYVTPEADHRLHLTRHFTLARDVGTEETVIFVGENPEGTVMHPKCRVLKFGTELITYEGYTAEPPYCFTGCVRGAFETRIKSHERGCVGGILDITEFGGSSVYPDQNTDLPDEIGDKLAQVYNTGFEFVYYDGSEGTNAPFDYHIANAQYRVWKKFENPPLFAEGAAKTHFSWHMLSGGNAFDVFPPAIFKEKIVEHPVEEAPRMAQDLTRLDFGWWQFYPDVEPDMYEFANGCAAAWDCPVTVAENLEAFRKNPRTEDIFESLRRWEDVRAKNWLTQAQKEMLKNTSQEHILLQNGAGEYELMPYNRIEGAAGGDKRVSAYVFERGGKIWAVCWHNTGSGILELPVQDPDAVYTVQIDGKAIAVERNADGMKLPVSGRRYLRTGLSREALIQAFRGAKLTETEKL